MRRAVLAFRLAVAGAVSLAVLFLPLFSSPAQQKRQRDKSQAAAGDEIMIIAEYKEYTEERVFASGNVEVHYGDLILFADQVEIMVETKDVRAEGRVVVQTPNEVVSAVSLVFNLDTALGRLEKAVGMVQPSLYYEAESLEKKDEFLYHLEKASFTSCSQPVPRWRFSSSRADLKKDEYVKMWGAVFRIKDVPVFYLPYLKYPLSRQSGFLFPDFDYNGSKGLMISLGYYWAMKRNMDATFTLDYFSRKGVGGRLDYRYLFSGGTGGEIHLRGFTFKKGNDGLRPDDAYIIRAYHNQLLPLGFALVAEVDYQSSYDFLREFENDFNRATVSNQRTQAYLSKSWSKFSFSVRASRFETRFEETGNAIITKYLPQVSFNSFKIKLFQPLYFSFASAFSRWEYGWETEFEEGTEKRSQSLWFAPTLSLPLTSIPWLTVNTALTANMSYYWQSLTPDAQNPNKQVIVDKPFFSRNFTLNLDFLGPVFFRVFQGPDGSARVKHIIEPSVRYRYDSPSLNSEKIVTSHGFFRYHQLSYGLTNHILVKQEKMPREIFTFGVSQTYYLAPEESPLSRYRVDGKIPEFTDITSYIRFYPRSKFSLDFSAGYNPYHKTFSSLRLSANAGSPADRLFFGVSWVKSLSVWQDEPWGDRHQVNIFGKFKLPALKLETQVELNYNILQKELLHAGVFFVHNYQCLNIVGEVRYYQTHERPFQYRITLELGEIDTTTEILGGLRF